MDHGQGRASLDDREAVEEADMAAVGQGQGQAVLVERRWVGWTM